MVVWCKYLFRVFLFHPFAYHSQWIIIHTPKHHITPSFKAHLSWFQHTESSSILNPTSPMHNTNWGFGMLRIQVIKILQQKCVICIYTLLVPEICNTDVWWLVPTTAVASDSPLLYCYYIINQVVFQNMKNLLFLVATGYKLETFLKLKPRSVVL